MAKQQKRRRCPAVDRIIEAAECGANRISRYACPPTCPFNPFARANYDHFGPLEENLDRASAKWLLEHDVHREAVRQEFRSIVGEPHRLIVHHLFFRRDEAGHTAAERWLEDKTNGLRNDARVLLQGKMRTRIALFEVREVIDHQTVRGFDHWADPAAPLTVVDRSFASRALRFEFWLGWLYPAPHFTRISGDAMTVPELGPPPPVALGSILRHLGAPEADQERQLWLSQHQDRVREAILALVEKGRQVMLEQVDFTVTTVTYQLRQPLQQVRQRLTKAKWIEADAIAGDENRSGFEWQAYVCFADTVAPAPHRAAGGRMVLGRAFLAASVLELEITGAARSHQLRQAIETWLGPAIRFDRERSENKGLQLAQEVAARIDPSLIPPDFLFDVPQVEISSSRLPADSAVGAFSPAEFCLRQLRDWVDTPVPALDGQTPRLAAAQPELRPRVLVMMKSQLTRLDRENLVHETACDANSLIRELGWHELDIPAPPRRTCPPDLRPDEDCSEGGESDNEKEAISAVDKLFGEFDEASVAGYRRHGSAESSYNAFLQVHPKALPELDLMTRVVSEEGQTALLMCVLNLWFVLRPDGGSLGRMIAPDALMKLERTSAQLEVGSGEDGLERNLRMLVKGCRDVGLFVWLAEVVAPRFLDRTASRGASADFNWVLACLRELVNQVAKDFDA